MVEIRPEVDADPTAQALGGHALRQGRLALALALALALTGALTLALALARMAFAIRPPCALRALRFALRRGVVGAAAFAPSRPLGIGIAEVVGAPQRRVVVQACRGQDERQQESESHGSTRSSAGARRLYSELMARP
jgi:hypothetical protein